MRALYFGTKGRPGHWLYDEHMRRVDPTRDRGAHVTAWPPLPWRRIDGALCPRPAKQGECALHHLDGWTALAFWNRTDDTRPGSNSVFFFEATLTFSEAVAEARRRFPGIVERFAFELVPAPGTTQ